MILRRLLALMIVVTFIAGCQDKLDDVFDNPNETANVVMSYRVPVFEDTAYLGIVGQNVLINWGDGTQDSFPSLSLSPTEVPVNVKHRYSEHKDYVIKITSADLTRVSTTYLARIDTRRATKLKTLHIPGCFLTSLDVKSNLALEDLWCNANTELSKLDLSQNSLLKKVEASTCGLTELNISNCNQLVTLVCENNRLSDVNLKGKLLLEGFHAGHNNLTAVDFSENINLRQVSVGNNKLSKVDLSACPKLEQISFSTNHIEQITLTPTPQMHTVYIRENKLTTLDLSGMPALRVLDASTNAINQLEVSGKYQLVNLLIRNNQLNSQALNSIFSAVNPPQYGPATMAIANNPGVSGCDTTIAVAKGWKVVVK